jgi:hypothetical protein
MRDKRPSTPRHPLRTVAAILAAGVGLAAIYSCSLIVDTQSQQCQSNQDCVTMFGAGSTCSTAMGGVCLTAATTSSSSTGTTSTTGSSTSTSSTTTSSTSSSSGTVSCDVDGGIDGGGCYDDSLATCQATSNAEILNACTTGCIAFDNGTLKGFVDAGLALPALPTPGPDGGL